MPGFFDPSEWGGLLASPYPREAFLAIGTGVSPEEGDVPRFVRLWLTEGIPFCFQEMPMVYEKLREYVGYTLRVRARDVSMIGSGRVGFSLSPRKPLRLHVPGVSDIDLFVVSPNLFDTLSKEFNIGMELWENGTVVGSPRETKYLPENSRRVPKAITRGFIDSNKVPVFRDLSAFRNFTSYVPSGKLKCDTLLSRIATMLNSFGTSARFQLDRELTTLRVYRSWDDAIKQNVVTVQSVIDSLNLEA